ncbi:unnamed protein product [Didymodactylos carnosus]|uniref:N-acyl-aliphatic-L-amino acid amidohydrolase n=1 Tax=Didymodactylos carnosus TaxID=1234261 RepID=A0A816CWD6_9BILA|nr:unnamed protein product [Didymodactylos carnosus]CAF4526887.1 unnamed protein product [Didymodactylos carnosus]
MAKLEAHLYQSQFGRGPGLNLLNGITPYTSWYIRFVLANLWLFGSLVEKVFSKKPALNALQRTTIAVTLISGGVKENTLPPSAQSNVNHRIHPADSCQKIFEQNKRIINDERVKGKIKSCVEPSPISPFGDHVWPYSIIKHTIRQTFNGTIVVLPGLSLGGTDSKSYTSLTKNLYRFSPCHLMHSDFPRIHGINERITKADVERYLNFFYHLIVNSNLEILPKNHIKTEL